MLLPLPLLLLRLALVLHLIANAVERRCRADADADARCQRVRGEWASERSDEKIGYHDCGHNNAALSGKLVQVKIKQREKRQRNQRKRKNASLGLIVPADTALGVRHSARLVPHGIL